MRFLSDEIFWILFKKTNKCKNTEKATRKILGETKKRKNEVYVL